MQNNHGIIDAMTLKIKQNAKPLAAAAAAVILLIGAGYLWCRLKHKNYQKEWGGLFMAELDILSPEGGELSLTALEDFALKNENTGAGAYADFMLGNAYYQTKDYQKAELHFRRTASKGRKELAAMAEISLTAVLTAQQLYDDAIKQADAFIAKNPTHFALPQALQYKALSEELSGKTEAAKADYNKIAQEYPNTYYALFAQTRLKKDTK